MNLVTEVCLRKAIAVGCLRVIDESGEDYLYAKEQFVVVDLPEAARSQLLAAIAQEIRQEAAVKGLTQSILEDPKNVSVQAGEPSR